MTFFFDDSEEIVICAFGDVIYLVALATDFGEGLAVFYAQREIFKVLKPSRVIRIALSDTKSVDVHSESK